MHMYISTVYQGSIPHTFIYEHAFTYVHTYIYVYLYVSTYVICKVRNTGVRVFRGYISAE